MKSEQIEGTWYLQRSAENYTFIRNKDEIGPRRFYARLVLNEDQSFEWITPGPTDQPEVTSGKWKLETESSIRFNTENKDLLISIVELDSTSLTLNQLPK